MIILKTLQLGVLAFLFSFSVFAEDISRGHVEQMLDSMVAQGIIPEAEADNARQKLKTISSEEWSKINMQAQLMAERYKAKNPQVELSAQSAAGNVNFDGEMYKEIEKEIHSQMSLSRLPASE